MMIYLIMGLLLGAIVNYFSIGFCGAVYNTVKGNNSIGFRTILISILVGGIGIYVVKAMSEGAADFVGVMGIDIALIVGAFIFGIGMIVSDGCILGIVRDLGNGYVGHIVTVIFVTVGTLLGNLTYKSMWLGFKEKSIYVYLPDTFGEIAGLIIFIVLILFVYFGFYLRDRMSAEESDECRLPKKSLIGGLALGIFLICYQIATGIHLGISGV